MIALLLACTPEPTGPTGAPPPVVEEDPIGVIDPILAEGVDTPLSRRLTLATDVPTALTLTLSSGDEVVTVAFPGRATEHAVPVHGLKPGRTWTVEIGLEAEDGRTAERALEVDTEPLPPEFPRFDLLASDPERSAGGWWLMPFEIPGNLHYWLVMLDPADGEVAWLYDGPINWGDVRPTADGTLIGLAGGAVEMDLLGGVLRSYRREPVDEPNVTLIPWALNHELLPNPDGSFTSIAATSIPVPDYPLSYEDPTPAGPSRVVDARVVRFASDGTVISNWLMSGRLDTRRIGFNSLVTIEGGFDWVHANGVIADGDGWIVSLRHQDAVIRLHADGALDWILGDPAGWDRPWSTHLLAPEEGTEWPYHQHGPVLDDAGRLWMFDNRTVEATPYAGVDPGPGASRIVAYAIDAGARTVRQEAEWHPPVELRSNALGSVHPVGDDGHLLVDFGMLVAEGDVMNVDAGRGKNSTRIVEVDPDEAEPVVDVRVWTDPARVPAGVNVYRVVPVASPYPEGVVLSR